MRYQLVALFDDESNIKIEDIRKYVSRKYRLYKNNSMLYIPISTLSNPDVDKLDDIISKLLEPYKKFKVKVNNSICLNSDNRQVNLLIDEKGYMSRICRNMIDTLILHGFTINDDASALNLHIPLANANYNIKKACSSSAIPVNKNLTEDYLKFAKVDRIELWKVNSSKKDMIVKSFPLRQY